MIDKTERVQAPRTSKGVRALPAAAGVLTLVVGAIFTLGGALLAALGVWIAWLIARRRGKTLSLGMSWIAAVAPVALLLVAFGAWMATKAPPGTMARIQHATDSAQANPPPPPRWLERIAPGSTARANAQRARGGAAFGVWALVVGAGILTGMFSGFVGSLGWLGALLLAYGINGRWIGAEPRQPAIGDELAAN
jgi:hypothetical protein